MSKLSKQLSDRITVMVFKDNYAARTFQVPLAWLNRFGLLLLVFTLTTLVAGLLAAKYYRISRTADLSRVQQLEVEIGDLQVALRQSQGRPTEVTEAPATFAVTPPPGTPQSDQAAGMPPFAPAQPSTVSAPPRSYVFAALPPEATPVTGEPPIIIGAPKAVWQGNILHVTFNIQYQRGDRGNQQGRIVILARGPETLMAYPEGVLSTGGIESLIQPLRGEYFSVSRFRAVSAQFGPMRDTGQLKEVELLLVSDSGQLIMYDRLPVSGAVKNVVTEPFVAPVVEPAKESAKEIQ